MITYHHTLTSGPLPEARATHEASCGCLVYRHRFNPRYYVVVTPCGERYAHKAGITLHPERAPVVLPFDSCDQVGAAGDA